MTTPSLDAFHSDVILHIAQYLNVLDAGPLLRTSKRYYYLVHQLRQLLGVEMAASCAPAMSTCADASNSSFVGQKTKYQSAFAQIRLPPTLAMCFERGYGDGEIVYKMLPPATVVVGVAGNDIQTNIGGAVNSNSQPNVLLGNLGAGATVKPFAWGELNTRRRFLQTVDVAHQVESMLAAEPDDDFQVFFIYASGRAVDFLGDFVTNIQSRYPNAVLVGGICQGGFISQPNDNYMLTFDEVAALNEAQVREVYVDAGGARGHLEQFPQADERVKYVYRFLQSRPYVCKSVTNAVWGVALGGNVPVRSVVSRGVKKLTPDHVALLVESDEQLPDGQGYLIHAVSHRDARRPFSVAHFLQQHEQVDFCGLRLCTIPAAESATMRVDGFELHSMSEAFHDDDGNIVIKIARTPSMVLDLPSGRALESLRGAQLDFFNLDGPACQEHMQETMKLLKGEIDAQKQHVLAAIMVSCNGRGPRRGALMAEPMADATSFRNEFGALPCVGFYAGGEVGPLAMAPPPGERANATVFQRGGAVLQGFTAVFALFIAPKVDLCRINIDDSPERVDQFLQSKMFPQHGEGSSKRPRTAS